MERQHDARAATAGAGELAPVQSCYPGRRRFSFTSGCSSSTPTVQHLFAGVELAEQERKLMAMFAQIVDAIDRPEELVSSVAALGRRHVHYGVKDADYDSIGAALLWTLEQALGDGFTPEIRAAWAEAYLTVSAVMRRAAIREQITGERPVPLRLAGSGQSAL